MKHKISISVDAETLDKIDANVKSRKFRNRSHAFEYSIEKILEKKMEEER